MFSATIGEKVWKQREINGWLKKGVFSRRLINFSSVYTRCVFYSLKSNNLTNNCYIPSTGPEVIFSQKNIIEVWRLALNEVRSVPKLNIFLRKMKYKDQSKLNQLADFQLKEWPWNQKTNNCAFWTSAAQSHCNSIWKKNVALKTI